MQITHVREDTYASYHINTMLVCSIHFKHITHTVLKLKQVPVTGLTVTWPSKEVNLHANSLTAIRAISE